MLLAGTALLLRCTIRGKLSLNAPRIAMKTRRGENSHVLARLAGLPCLFPSRLATMAASDGVNGNASTLSEGAANGIECVFCMPWPSLQTPAIG
jgi:hypothetical protein